jgi:hypothetical protein
MEHMKLFSDSKSSTKQKAINRPVGYGKTDKKNLLLKPISSSAKKGTAAAKK